MAQKPIFGYLALKLLRMTVTSLIFFILALIFMLGGMIYYIVIGSKKDLHPMKAAAIIGGCLTIGLIFAVIALMMQDV